MMKRMLTLLLSVILMVSILPIPATAVTQTEEEQIKSEVTKVVRDYAKQVYMPNADDKAFDVFFNHGFYKNGADMHLKESDAMVSSLFNSELMQVGLIECITAAIKKMQSTNTDALYITGGPGWHEFFDTFGYYVYLGDQRDEANYLGTLVHGKDIYGDKGYTGPLNENDNVMRLLVGSSESGSVLRKKEIVGNKITYTLDLYIYDRFDFTSDYDHIKDSGYDTSTDSTLINIGYLLTYIGLDEFDWEFKKTFEFTVPLFCDHLHGNNYHWTYDVHNQTMSVDTSENFSENEPTKHAASASNNTSTSCYFELEQSVILQHDLPWVIEYNVHSNQYLSFSSASNTNNGKPYLYQGGLVTLV